jgi:hypothetical protein
MKLFMVMPNDFHPTLRFQFLKYAQYNREQAELVMSQGVLSPLVGVCAALE